MKRTGRMAVATMVAAFLAIAVLSAVSFFRSPRIGSVAAATDRILVEKTAHRMTLFKGGHIVRSYDVALGRGGEGDKQRAGDNKVPEGIYRIVGRNPKSAFHLALRVGYPTAEQERIARAKGIDPGGDIMIHGIRNGLGWIGAAQRSVDWTRGCVAVTDSEIEEIWRLVPDGTEIQILP